MKLSLVFTAISVGALAVNNASPIRAYADTDGTVPNFAYVAFGDSLTTGSSIATCIEDRNASPWGCKEVPPAAVPYPERLAVDLGMSYSNNPSDYRRELLSSKQPGGYRAGIWGYTLKEAVQAHQNGKNSNGDWLPQIDAISHATELVTGSLGINDLQFSNVQKWAKLYLSKDDKITPEARRIIKDHSADFDVLFSSLKDAKSRGANVVLTLYYNPYDTDDAFCQDLKVIGNRLVNTLDAELKRRSERANLNTADFRKIFRGHGAGSANPYVFGTECRLSSAVISWLPKWLGGGGGVKALAQDFDPHPNDAGTFVMARVIKEHLNVSAD